MIVFPHLNICPQPSSIDENAGFKVEKGNPARLVQIVCLSSAAKRNIASSIHQHDSNNFDIDILVH